MASFKAKVLMFNGERKRIGESEGTRKEKSRVHVVGKGILVLCYPGMLTQLISTTIGRR